MELSKDLPGKLITSKGKCHEKSVSFKIITELVNDNKLIKPPFQTDLDEDKVEEMIESYDMYPEYLIFRNKIVIVITHKSWYVVDGQHRIEMAKKIYETKETTNDILNFCYIEIETEEEMKRLFIQINKDSYKISKYISLDDFTQNIYDQLKQYFLDYKSKFFADKKNQVNKKYTICEFLDKLTEYKIFEKFTKVKDLIDEIKNKNTLFCNKIEYIEYNNDEPSPFYADEKECINNNIIYSLKNNNFIEYLADNNIVPDHTFKLNKKYIAPKLVISVWKRYFGNSVNGLCPICDKQIKAGKNGFVCKPIISYLKGGEDTVENLRPICGVCSKEMGNKNWDDYEKKKLNQKIKSNQKIKII